LEQKSFAQYFGLMERARNADPDLDLIVWPEGAFTESLPELIVDTPVQAPPDSSIPLEEIQANVGDRQEAFTQKVHVAAQVANRDTNDVHLLAGVTTYQLRGAETRQHNSALWIQPNGRIGGRYFKVHLVMFGEYVPFSRLVPWLANVTPIGQGLTPGTGPSSFEVQGFRLAPSICFESTVPHLIRRQVRRLAAETGHAPDILVNITDDGWFWGSSILDLHLACAVLRAVELRRPFLVAANTGISAHIDGNGRVLERLPHRREGFILAAVPRDGRFSFYERWGDLFAGACLAATILCLIRKVKSEK
jgi:apolipoprotein N-acyltransferase